MFLLGDLFKGDVCIEVSSCGFVVVDKFDSYDICFIVDGDI